MLMNGFASAGSDDDVGTSSWLIFVSNITLKIVWLTACNYLAHPVPNLQYLGRSRKPSKNLGNYGSVAPPPPCQRQHRWRTLSSLPKLRRHKKSSPSAQNFATMLARIFHGKTTRSRMKAKIIITPKKAVLDPQGK